MYEAGKVTRIRGEGAWRGADEQTLWPDAIPYGKRIRPVAFDHGHLFRFQGD